MSAPGDIRIPAGGEQIAAYLYRPDGAGPAPCIVMAHGFTATRDDGLPRYAEAFRDAGYAVVLFDYRHFGASTGEPRQLLDVGRQHDDYRTVLAWARQSDGVDPARMVLWGTSYSGGHVLAVAADGPTVAAVIAQAPFTDAIPTLRLVPPATAARATFEGIRDEVRARRGRTPVYLSAVGAPGTVAAMTAPDAQPGFEALVAPESLWRNEFAARLMLRFAFYRPGRKAARLPMPVLFCVCENDSTTPAKSAIAAAHRAPRGELRLYSSGHFNIYHDPAALADQLDFLQRVVPAGG